ncbi:homeobox-leucine zipper protein ROC8, partial [Tanacetum coccineum]
MLYSGMASVGASEASRAFAVVKMHHLDLAERLAENEWSCLFPNIVANEKTKQVLSPASSEDNPHGTLRVVYREMQATSPVVPNRKFTVLRSCTQIDQATWLIAEISHVLSPNTYRRLPSGCLIQRLSEYESKVTWVEHTEVIAESPPNQTFYDHLIRTDDEIR